MTLLQTASLLVALAALLSYANRRTVRLPSSIGLMLMALLMSLGLIALGRAGVPVDAFAREAVGKADFGHTLLSGMLGFLLFAGAIQVDISRLAEQRWPVAFLAVIGVVISTLVVGFGTWWVLGLLGQDVPLIWCMVFGALISPTDPVAVLAIIRSIGVPKPLEMKIAGESLFNDGVGVVVFIELLGVAQGERSLGVAEVAGFFAREAIGGALFGLAIGYLVYGMLRRVDDYEVEVLLTVGLVMGGYAAAEALGLSAPIAIVCAGLLVGNRGRRYAMSDRTQQQLDAFWELIDSMLNAVLFMVIGLELVLIAVDVAHLEAMLAVIPIVLAGRVAAVALPAVLPGLRHTISRSEAAVLVWGGLRGGISVALALSLPDVEQRETLISLTYAVVVFAILVQGLTVGRLAQALTR